MVPPPILTEWAPARAALRKKNSLISTHNLRSSQCLMSKKELDVTAINNSLGGSTAKLTEMEQNMGALAARITALERGTGSSSGASGSLQDLGLAWMNTLVAPRPKPDSVDEHRNMRRKLETSPDDENSRSAVFLRFSCTQSCAGVSSFLAQELSGSEKDYGVKNAGAVACRLELSLRRKPCANSPWHNTRMMAYITQSTASSANKQLQSLSASPSRRLAMPWVP